MKESTNHLAIYAIVQARMGSTRLPGKVLKTVLCRPLLSYLVERLKRVPSLSKIIIATTTRVEDNAIETFCKEESIPCFRGDSLDVLSRYIQAMRFFGADIGLRITGDCPLIDPVIVEQAVHLFLDTYPQYDYVSNCFRRTYPRGMDVEVFSYETLERVFEEAEGKEREHVTQFILNHPSLFNIGSLEEKENLSSIRLTVDTPEDFLLISKIIENLYPERPYFSLQDIITLLSRNPKWLEINAHVQQKER